RRAPGGRPRPARGLGRRHAGAPSRPRRARRPVGRGGRAHALRARGGSELEDRAAAMTVEERIVDRLGPAELAPHLRGAWRRVHWLEEVDSTQRVARELARAGAAEGATVIAERQTAGRGRLGRQWHSPAGVNLYCSI